MRQQERMINLEDRSQQKNLMVFGIAENEKESTDDLKSKVLTDIFEEILGVTLTTVERIHRVGKKNSNKPRPVVLRLFDCREKSKLYQNCKKLKGSGISIGDDFSKETLAKRKLLWNSAKQKRDDGERVQLNHDKLIINSDVFVWDYSKNGRVRIRRNNNAPSSETNNAPSSEDSE